MSKTVLETAPVIRQIFIGRGILPQGDGQTLTISGQTNAKYYQSYSISFFDPWFGGKRPNSLSVSAFFSVQTDISSRYYNSSYFNNYYNSMYSGYGGYGMYNYGNYNNYEKLVNFRLSLPMIPVCPQPAENSTWSLALDVKGRPISTVPFTGSG